MDNEFFILTCNSISFSIQFTIFVTKEQQIAGPQAINAVSNSVAFENHRYNP